MKSTPEGYGGESEREREREREREPERETEEMMIDNVSLVAVDLGWFSFV